MTIRLLAISAILSVTMVSWTGAQVTIQLSPLDVPTDPRGVGLGESLVALPANPAALLYNPAGLSGVTGAGLTYCERSMAWGSFLDGYTFYGLSGSAETPVGVFGVRYDKFTQGEGAVLSPSSPLGYGEVKHYSYDIALGYGSEITRGLDIGVAAKYYDDVFDETSRVNPAYPVLIPSTTAAWLFDAGLLYAVPEILPQGKIRSELTFGISVQNIGTKIKYHVSGESESSDQSLPEYFHAGLALNVHQAPTGEGTPQTLALIFTAEYSNLFNYAPGVTGGYASWGSGLEILLDGIISLRGGIVIQPITNVYGEEGTIAYRYGTGVNLPLERLGIPIPLILSASYAAIPLHDVGLVFFGPQRHTLDTFSFDVRMQ